MFAGHSHSFDHGIAKSLGIQAAVILNQLQTSACSGLSISYICETVPYLSMEEIKNALEVLKNANFITVKSSRIYLVEGEE